jgi:hypothetical protein
VRIAPRDCFHQIPYALASASTMRSGRYVFTRVFSHNGQGVATY